jgi:hypothetical protein
VTCYMLLLVWVLFLLRRSFLLPLVFVVAVRVWGGGGGARGGCVVAGMHDVVQRKKKSEAMKADNNSDVLVTT